jgi:hypothetical protein
VFVGFEGQVLDVVGLLLFLFGDGIVGKLEAAVDLVL